MIICKISHVFYVIFEKHASKSTKIDHDDDNTIKLLNHIEQTIHESGRDFDLKDSDIFQKYFSHLLSKVN